MYFYRDGVDRRLDWLERETIDHPLPIVLIFRPLPFPGLAVDAEEVQDNPRDPASQRVKVRQTVGRQGETRTPRHSPRFLHLILTCPKPLRPDLLYQI